MSTTPVSPNNENSPNPSVRDAWSLRIATVAGIPIRLHFTFLLLLIWFSLAGIAQGGGGGMVLLLLGLFTCVALHELGHSLVAQRYGYKVHDIVLYPIGGIASIETTPRPRHELYIALAGPAVNVVIAALLYLYLSATGGLPQAPVGSGSTASEFVARSPLAVLLSANIALVLFNMIPAFPMDGGRVLRAVLALRIGKARATQAAARIGQFVALLMAAYGLGLLGNPLRGVPFVPQPPNFGLVIIALFVFFGAGQEVQAETTREIAEGAPVGDAMVREFQTLAVGDSLRRAADVLLAGSQQDFPVVHGEEIVGVLSRGQLLRGLAQDGESAYVSGAMTREVVFVRPSDPLQDVMLRPDGVSRAPILVRDESERLVGMLTTENLMEFLTLRRIAQAREEQHNGDRR